MLKIGSERDRPQSRRRRRPVQWLAAGLVCATFVTPAVAADRFIDRFQAQLYAGNTAGAAAEAEARLREAPEDTQARFGLGTAQFLTAVEHLGQSLYRYGLKGGDYGRGLGVVGLPFLRLPVPHNPAPEKITYEALRSTFQSFVNDLAVAQTTLAGIGNNPVALPLNVGLIRLDLNGDGTGGPDEALWQMFAAVTGAGWLNAETAKAFKVDFDSADVTWLQGYTHLLMGIAEFPLAHDWREAFDATIVGLFHNNSPLVQKLGEGARRAQVRLKEIGPLPPYNPDRLPTRQWWDSPQGQRYNDIRRQQRSYKQRIEYGWIADLIAFVHLNHWPVVEPERMGAVLRHLEAMVALSRENWKRIVAETDNGAEWVPNVNQTGVLQGMTVTQERIEGWHAFLDEFEAILQGRKLIPHWRFDEGINMRRVFLEPRTFDIVLMLQGSAALPYLEAGELTDERTWRQITRLMGGDIFRYFIWFN